MRSDVPVSLFFHFDDSRNLRDRTFCSRLTLREESQVKLLGETPNRLDARATLAKSDGECQSFSDAILKFVQSTDGYKLPSPIPEKPSVFHLRAQRNAFRCRDVRAESHPVFMALLGNSKQRQRTGSLLFLLSGGTQPARHASWKTWLCKPTRYEFRSPSYSPQADLAQIPP